jgi:large subunit ribosomal protein L22
MAFGVKTNERPGTRASVHHVRVSAYKAREVLNLIRGKHVNEADAILSLTERGVAPIIRKVLNSAVANAQNNDDQDPETLYVSACYADEGPTMKRWRPRARGRATRIRKRTCHITVIVSRMSDDDLRIRADRETARTARGGTSRRSAASAAEARRRRVAGSRRRRGETHDHDHDHDHEADTDEADADAEVVEEAADVATAEEAVTDETSGAATEEATAEEATAEVEEEAPSAEASGADEAGADEQADEPQEGAED